MKELPGWLRFISWLEGGKDRGVRVSRAWKDQVWCIDPDASFACFARAKFSPGLAPAGIRAAVQKIMDGRLVSAGEHGARLYVTGGMPRGATQ